METGCVNVFCLLLLVCSPSLRPTKHFCSSQLPGSLVLPMLEFVPSFVHLADAQKGQEGGRGVVGSFRGSTEPHREVC